MEKMETGYALIQATKPQSLGYGLNDSPAGLAAWIVEKFHGWSDCGGNIETKFTKDELLTNIMIYWITQTINSSMRLYYEAHATGWKGPDGKVTVPTGFTLSPIEGGLPRKWAEQFEQSFNVTHWNVMPSGGHFLALEEPELLVKDIRKFFRDLR
jgi:pimeloyl-ACP methyl ester carboxylesterase